MFGWFDSKAVDAFADGAVADLIALAAKVHRGLSSALPGRPLGLDARLAAAPAGGAR